MRRSVPALGFGLQSCLASFLVIWLTACVGSAAIGLSSVDNNPELVSQALTVHKKPRVGVPMNATGRPMAFFDGISILYPNVDFRKGLENAI